MDESPLNRKNRLPKTAALILFFSILFLFRLLYGLSSEFWFEDELQIYLLGLKFFTTGEWPFFGPDVVYTQSQIPGALQALLVGIPFHILPIPEAPAIFLNILSFFSLLFFGKYLLRLFPSVPRWFIWLWLFTAPWTLNMTTHVLNPSYILPASVFFFVSILELTPRFRTGFIGTRTAVFITGASLLWIFQLHMSWVLFVPFILFVLILQIREHKGIPASYAVLFFLGSASVGSLLLPTFIKYGFLQGMGGTSDNVVFKPDAFLNIFYIVPRFLSFGSFELTRFLGPDIPSRTLFLKEFFWAAPFAIVAAIIGGAQVLWMLYRLISKESETRWRWFKLIIWGILLIVYVLFFFSIKGPSSHTYFALFPLAMILFFYSIKEIITQRFCKIMAVVLIISGIVTHLAIGIRNFESRSLYKDRAKVVKALEERDYKILGERRQTRSGIGY
jgi:hypothetical protein